MLGFGKDKKSKENEDKFKEIDDEFKSLKGEFKSLKGEVKSLKGKVKSLKGKVENHDLRIRIVEKQVEQELKQMGGYKYKTEDELKKMKKIVSDLLKAVNSLIEHEENKEGKERAKKLRKKLKNHLTRIQNASRG